MIRNKWLTSGDTDSDRPLTVSEVADFVRGYSQVRDLTEAECAAFPVVWAVYQADRLLRDHRFMKRASLERRARWPIADQISMLPEEIDRAGELLELALGSCLRIDPPNTPSMKPDPT